MQKAES